MHDPGCRQREHGAELGEHLPAERSRPPAPAQPIPPRALDAPLERFQLPVVATDPVVLVVPTELLAQHPVLCPKRVVPMRAAPMPHRPHRALQPLLGCTPLNHPVSPPGLRPVVGQSKKVERAVPTLAVVRLTRRLELDQAGLLRMNGKLERAKRFGKTARIRRASPSRSQPMTKSSAKRSRKQRPLQQSLVHDQATFLGMTRCAARSQS